MHKIILLLVITAILLPSLSSAEEAEHPAIKPALLVIDIQNEYIPMMDERGQDMTFRIINGVIWQFRQHGLPVIRVYHTSPQWGPEPGSEGFEFSESVLIKEEDPKIIKNFPSAFTKTDLDKILKEKGANTLFLCGLSATGCVLATYFGAMDRGYDVFMIEGALMSPNAEQTEAVKDFTESVGWGSLELILKAAKGALPEPSAK